MCGLKVDMIWSVDQIESERGLHSYEKDDRQSMNMNMSCSTPSTPTYRRKLPSTPNGSPKFRMHVEEVQSTPDLSNAEKKTKKPFLLVRTPQLSPVAHKKEKKRATPFPKRLFNDSSFLSLTARLKRRKNGSKRQNEDTLDASTFQTGMDSDMFITGIEDSNVDDYDTAGEELYEDLVEGLVEENNTANVKQISDENEMKTQEIMELNRTITELQNALDVEDALRKSEAIEKDRFDALKMQEIADLEARMAAQEATWKAEKLAMTEERATWKAEKLAMTEERATWKAEKLAMTEERALWNDQAAAMATERALWKAQEEEIADERTIWKANEATMAAQIHYLTEQAEARHQEVQVEEEEDQEVAGAGSLAQQRRRKRRSSLPDLTLVGATRRGPGRLPKVEKRPTTKPQPFSFQIREEEKRRKAKEEAEAAAEAAAKKKKAAGANAK